jgi:hypothetical protein
MTMSLPPNMLPEIPLGEHSLDQKYHSRPRRSPFPEKLKETVYSAQRWWMLYHAASWHHRLPEPRVTLHSSYLVSLYDPSYSSLARNNKLPVRKHRLLDLSTEDRTSFKAETEQVVTAWHDDDYGHHQENVESYRAVWRGIARYRHVYGTPHFTDERLRARKDTYQVIKEREKSGSGSGA